ncbi:MAG TPA: DUF424 family protein [Candidatus Methanofastidiosa archaeon]|nr:DUF424 family protein [Candidatus Methanofastidiosa archaeon]HPR40944.1 DUF424 family protein [Candidatus Methanofastidiosa archaeon]
MKVYVKVHKACNDVLVAVCDEDVLGKEFKEGRLKLFVNESFYKGKLIEMDELEKFLKLASILNIVGHESIRRAVECEFIDEDNILNIGSTRHAQMVTV